MSEPSIFKNAANTRIDNSSFIVNNIQLPGADSTADPLNKLYSQVATNAILNAGGRADEVKCYPGTREEVIGLIERWMDSDRKDSTIPNMLWLSGPAGAGKSAIVQTIAERCKEMGKQAANFFFFRADPTRNTARPLVATLLYQIVKVCPSARQAIATALSNDPLLFGAPIKDQFHQLLFLPLQGVPSPIESSLRQPVVIIIDGLDECDSQHNSSQKHILQALNSVLMQNNSPFIVLVASRAEPQITMAFKQLTCSVQSIFLDEQYAPEKDIRMFVTGEFNKIKQSHHLAHTLSDDWPSKDDSEAIVRKSSGHFIFAATVMRFLSNSSASPMLNLERVHGLVPADKISPFSQLDAIYTYILSQAENPQAVRDLLAAQLLHNALKYDGRLRFIEDELRFPIRTMLSVYDPARYSLALIDSCASELTAILRFQRDELKFYHASFIDFLEDESRSGAYHVDVVVFSAKIFPAIWMNAPESLSAAFTGIALLITLENPNPDITNALRTISPASVKSSDAMYLCTFRSINVIFRIIYNLYYPDDIRSYMKILRQWVRWFVFYRRARVASLSRNVNVLIDKPYLPYMSTCIRISKIEYWFASTLKATLHRTRKRQMSHEQDDEPKEQKKKAVTDATGQKTSLASGKSRR